MEPTATAQPLPYGIVHQEGMTIEDLLSKYSPAMYRAALHKLGKPEDAEDALQDALLSASRNLGQFKGECHISTWLVAIAINAARMHVRQGMRHRGLSLDDRSYDGTSRVVPEPADQRANPEQAYRKTELHGIISHVATQLSPSLRRAFRLRVFEGFSIRETAQALGVTEGTVKAQFFRARARMTTLMNQTLKLQNGGRFRPRPSHGNRKSRRSFS